MLDSRFPVIDSVLCDHFEYSPLNWIGFNVETVDYKNVSFTVWDVGGQDKVLCLILWIKALKMHA